MLFNFIFALENYWGAYAYVFALCVQGVRDIGTRQDEIGYLANLS